MDGHVYVKNVIKNITNNMKNLNKLDLDTAINLLENAVYFINQVPNHKYKTLDFHNSYDLASEIDAFLKKFKIEKE